MKDRRQDVEVVAEAFGDLWLKLPDLRLGQLVSCLNERAKRISGLPRCDEFAMSDLHMFAAIQEWSKEIADKD